MVKINLGCFIYYLQGLDPSYNFILGKLCIIQYVNIGMLLTATNCGFCGHELFLIVSVQQVLLSGECYVDGFIEQECSHVFGARLLSPPMRGGIAISYE